MTAPTRPLIPPRATSYPGIAQNATLIQALDRFDFAWADPGSSVPFGLLVAGIAATDDIVRLMPNWPITAGFLLPRRVAEMRAAQA